MKAMREITLGEIMSRAVSHVLPECTLGVAAAQMAEARISSLLVMSGNAPLGILTERDLLRLLSRATSLETPVAEIMSSPVLTASPEMSFSAAYVRLLNHHVRHLVVVDEAGDVVGLTSETDFRNHLHAGLLRQVDDLDAVMDRKLPQLSPDTPLDQALQRMLRDRMSFVLVVEQDRPIGILTERDMAGLLVQHTLPSLLTLRQVMHAPVLTAAADVPVFKMAGMMQAARLRHLVVVDERGRVMGMVTLHKLLEKITSSLMNEQALQQFKMLESEKQHAESLLSNIVQTIPDLVWLKDTDGCYLRCNSMFERFVGATEAEIVGQTDYDFFDREQADFFRAHDQQAMVAGVPCRNEEWITFADDGHRACVEVIKSPMFDADGRLIGVLGISRDITERKLAAEKIQRLTQLYSALSQCNQAIVRCTSEAELFAQICQDAVTHGGMKMAWIGRVDAENRVQPVAFDGEGTAYLQQVQISVDANSPLGQGPTGTAIRENRPFWCQDFQHDPLTAAWHEQGARFSWGASAALPLSCQGGVVGALTLYAGEVQAFDEAARRLLMEMAIDISFALENLAAREEQCRSQEKLALQVRRAEALLTLPDAAERMDEQSFMQYGIEIAEQLTDSQIAFIHIVNEDQETIELVTWSSTTLQHYCHAAHDSHYPITSAGIWADAFHQRQAVVFNDYATTPNKHGLPEGHAHLQRLISVPVIDNGLVRLMAGVGNKSIEYNELDIESVKLVASFVWSIVQKQRNEKALRKLSQAVEQSPSSIVITDLDANIEYANTAFSRVTGYSLAEVIGKNPRILHSGQTPRATYDDLWAHLAEGKSWKGELINRRKDGTDYIESALISPVRDASGKIRNYLAIKDDITEQRRVEARIMQLAHFDQLTLLPNQILLKDRVVQAISMAQRGQKQLALLFLDIDHFKHVNDTLGHRIGDELLVRLATRLKSLVRDEDTLSRMGGDEFILVLPGTDAGGAAHVAEKMIQMVAQTCHIEEHELVVTPSIGIAMYPSDGNDFDKLFQCADVAMYRAKQSGRNGFCFFTSEMQQRAARRLQLENALRHALERKQLQLYYQPQLSMQDGRVVGAEALLRWHHPELGMISPAEFIPVAEESGLILPIGEWVLRTAVQQVKYWMEQGQTEITVAVNLSAVQFRQANLPERIMQILQESGLPPKYIELELTESVAMETPLVAIAVMDELHARGIRMSIDDFGTGYSSLSYLKKFKVNRLKIDQSFVRDLAEDAESRAIVAAIITLAASMGFQTIAEGVETSVQLAYLRLQGCGEMQGYYFSKPLPVAEFERFMREQRKI